jgi:hypothetical protein
MTWKDKLEIGLKPDAPHRKDNLPEQEVRGPELDAGEGRSPVIPAAAADQTEAPPARKRPRLRNDAEIQEDSSDDANKDAVWVPDESAETGRSGGR